LESPVHSPLAGEDCSPDLTIHLAKIRNGEIDMENLIQLWLNPVNLGILFLCLTIGIWILSKSGPWNWDK
jgi:hypothetical protein